MIKNIVILVINFFDFFYKNKIINFLKKKKINIEYFIDVGAHHGETIDFSTGADSGNSMVAFSSTYLLYLNVLDLL